MANPSENPITPDATADSNEPLAESSRSCMWRLFSIFTWSVVVIVLVAVGFRVWFVHWHLDPAKKTELDKLDNEIIQIPPEWQHAAPKPPDEVIEFHKWFNGEMERLRFKYTDVLLGDNRATDSIKYALYRGDALTTSQQKIFSDFLVEFRPVMERTSTTISIPGYASYGSHNLIMATVFSEGTDLVAHYLANQGDYFTAMETAILPARYLHHATVARYATYVASYQLVASSAKTISAISEQCNDPKAVLYGLKLLTEEQALAHPERVDKLHIVEYVYSISEAMAVGYPVDISSQSMADLMDQETQTYTKSYFNWVIEHLPSSDSRVEIAKEGLEQISESDARANYGVRLLNSITQYQLVRRLAKFVIGYSPAALFLQTYGWKDPESVRIGVFYYTAKYELTRLRLAQRIVELENSTSQSLVLGPKAIAPVIQTIPADPFSTTTPPMPMRFSKSLNCFYSIGPDGDDDRMKVKYDADYGQIADGDIFLDPLQKP